MTTGLQFRALSRARQGLKNAVSINAEKKSLRAVAPSAPMTGKRPFAIVAPTWSDSMAATRLASGHRSADFDVIDAEDKSSDAMMDLEASAASLRNGPHQ